MSHESDGEVIGFFLKILKSVSAGLLWMMTMILLGLHFKLAYPGTYGVMITIVFYVVALVSLIFTVRHILKVIRSN